MRGRNNQPRWANALWSNEKILNMLTENSRLDADDKMYLYRADAKDICKHMRDEYERTLNKQQRRIEELEAENARLRAENDMLFTRAAIRLAAIKELQAGGKCMCRCDACKYCEQLLETT